MINVRGVHTEAPVALRVDVDAASELFSAFGLDDVAALIVRAREIGRRLQGEGVAVDASVLRAVCRLSDNDVDVALGAIAWLRMHSDLSGWTPRQLPVPRMHTKWLASHANLLARLAGRDVIEETRRRPAVVHLTYTDPAYLATGKRRHDAWTSDDLHDVAYRPKNVVIVENRDCRLWFPMAEATIVVEGEGKAVGALADVEWVLGAERIIYWGDMDAEGFVILNHLRRVLEARGAVVESLLMGSGAWERYKGLGVDRDKEGKPIRPLGRLLRHLSHDEADCYARLDTAGEVAIRRIEQERIPIIEAMDALREQLRSGPAMQH